MPYRWKPCLGLQDGGIGRKIPPIRLEMIKTVCLKHGAVMQCDRTCQVMVSIERRRR